MQTEDKEQIKKELKNPKELKKCAEEFSMVGDLTRLKICYLLCRHKELAVSEIANIIDVSISAVSHTLKKLQQRDIVKNRRDFRNVYYRLKATPFANVVKKRLKTL